MTMVPKQSVTRNRNRNLPSILLSILYFVHVGTRFQNLALLAQGRGTEMSAAPLRCELRESLLAIGDFVFVFVFFIFNLWRIK